MTTKAEREAAYQALVKLGVPIPPNEIDAVLEAAEGARGAERTALVDGLRGVARQLSHTARDWSSLQAADAEKVVMSAAHAVQEASDRLARLSSDARPAPMPEEVKAALGDIRTKAYWLRTEDNENASSDLYRSALTLSTHIDTLTRLNATLRERLYADLSRPQQTDAVLAERDACKNIALSAEDSALFMGDDARQVARYIADRIEDRPSPGPAPETERKDGEIARAIALLAKAQGKANIENWRDDVFSARQLLASVRPKEEGV